MFRQVCFVIQFIVFYVYGQEVENTTIIEHELLDEVTDISEFHQDPKNDGKHKENSYKISSIESKAMVYISSLTIYENIFKQNTNTVTLEYASNGRINFILPLKNNSNIEKQMTRLYREFEDDNCLIIPYDKSSLNWILAFVKVKTIIYPHSHSILVEKLRKFHAYIAIIKTIHDLEHFLTMLYGTPNWSYRAKYLLIYLGRLEDMEEIFKITWKYFLLDISVLIQHDQSFEVYTHFPYTNGSCGSNLIPVRLSDTSDIFPEKIDLDLKGCEIRIMGVKIKPYVIDITQPKDEPAKAGLEITIIHNVLQRMNFTEIYVPNPYPNWGFLLPDGNATMTIKSLQNREVDIIFGMMFSNETLVEAFDNAVPHIQSTSIWVVPTALQIAQWKNLAVIFDGIVWASIFFVFILNGFVWWFIGRKRETSASYNELSLCLMGSFYILLQGSVSTAKAWKLRFVVVIWSVASLLIFTAYQCQLTGILTSPLYEHQVSNLKELVESRLHLGIHPQLEALYTDPNNWMHRKILQNHKHCSLYPECVNRTAFKRDFATIKNRREIAYLMPIYYTDSSGKPMLYVFKHDELVFLCKYFMVKGFPFLKRVDTLIMRLQDAGLIAKWDSDLSSGFNVEDEPELEPLTINHLQGAFFLLFLGYFISSCIFLGEKFYGKGLEKKKKNQM